MAPNIWLFRISLAWLAFLVVMIMYMLLMH